MKTKEQIDELLSKTRVLNDIEEKSLNAFDRLVNICKVLNEGWNPNNKQFYYIFYEPENDKPFAVRYAYIEFAQECFLKKLRLRDEKSAKFIINNYEKELREFYMCPQKKTKITFDINEDEKTMHLDIDGEKHVLVDGTEQHFGCDVCSAKKMCDKFNYMPCALKIRDYETGYGFYFVKEGDSIKKEEEPLSHTVDDHTSQFEDVVKRTKEQDSVITEGSAAIGNALNTLDAEDIWEQRRYEISREAFISALGGSMNRNAPLVKLAVKDFVEMADMLIEELKKPNNNEKI